MATPTIWNPCGPYSFCNSTNHGISILQGPHQVAQKLRSTALPRKSESFTVLPSRDCSSKSGATCPCNFPETDPPAARFLRAARIPANNMTAMIAATTTGTKGFLFTSKLLLKRKTVQERQPTRDQGKATQYQQYAERNEQSPAGDFERVHMKL